MPAILNTSNNGAGSVRHEEPLEKGVAKQVEGDVFSRGLRHKSDRGILISIGGQLIKAVVHLVSLAVLGRLLYPSDFGLLAMVTSITIVLDTIRDGGMSNALIQNEDLTKSRADTMFWISIGFSALMGVIALLLAPLLSWFYKDSRIFSIAVFIAITIALNGVASPQQAMLRRQMRYGVVALIGVVSAVVGAACAIALASNGLGYWAIVAQLIVQAQIVLMLSWFCSPWRPSVSFHAEYLKDAAHYGGHLTGFNVLNFLARNLDNILIGRRFGSDALGLYSQAYSLILMPISLVSTPIGNVATSALSRLQSSPEQFKECYLRYVTLVASLTMPGASVMIVLADDIVAVMLGPRWGDAAPVLRVLSFCAVVQPLNNTASWIYFSLGRTARMCRFAVVSTILTAASFAAGLPFGILGVATAYTLYVLLHTYPSFYFALLDTGISIKDVAKPVAIPFAASLMCGLACWATTSQVSAPSIVRLLICIPICLAATWSIYRAFYGHWRLKRVQL